MGKRKRIKRKYEKVIFYPKQNIKVKQTENEKI